MITVGIVDDEALVRYGLRGILQTAPDLTVLGEAADGGGAVLLAEQHRPDVLLMDVQMPGVDGLSATESVLRASPGTAVLILTTFALGEYVYRAVRSGAAGFLVKDTAPADLLAAIRVVASGEAILSPRVTRLLFTRFGEIGAGKADRARELLSALSGRELEVLALVGQGNSNAEIAAALNVTESTVKAHVSRLMAKLSCANRVQAAMLARDAGLLG
ncbi:response regulator transcription factor [Kutzneria viridogrisea]|uniref:Response regulator receiver protein n=2 Tax=Kutzneria TaxID=43356 RepID=W5W5F0_9PSEU|nr:response regulator transcription factor [Kutzneria albida]AHH95666.1 response regulator receiver protein [Kutzneria albida DSM 43870]MBA8926971.1 DNA-binding NarL/FixJ family response regulator [Kutzneria viridogrisea]